MCNLLAKCSNVIVFDHHKTNLEVLVKLQSEFSTLTYYFDVERSGCQLTWDVVSEGRPRPLFLDYIGDRDLWKFELPDSKLITKALYICPATLESFDVLNTMVNFREKMVEQGSVLERQMNDFILPYYKSIACDRFVYVHEKIYNVKLVECPYFHRSEVGEYLSKSTDIVALWSYDMDSAKYSISFRSDKSRDDIDVGEIAKYYGGGGHKCASAVSWSDSLDKLIYAKGMCDVLDKLFEADIKKRKLEI
jgi:oligoribonuclease NrnB/cAMP/cGMP phosphodiesterase (DHH superfamily)